MSQSFPSAIEGEQLNVESVRSSIARRLGVDIGALAPVDRHIEGVVEMVLDATANAAVASGVLTAAGITPANAADAKVLTQVAYDSRGRVVSITRPAALVAGSAEVPARAARTFTYGAEGTISVGEPNVAGACCRS